MNVEQLYRAAVIGCGRIGADAGEPGTGSSRIASHAAAYATCPRTELVALCDTDPERLARAGQRWSVRSLYEDPSEMLAAERPDIVSVCTPPASHPAVLGESVRHGARGVLLEKPLAADLEGAKAILEVASSSPTTLAVNYIRRFPPVYRQAMADVREGRLGRIQHVGVLYTKGILNNGSHALDLLRAFFGEPASAEVVRGDPSGAADPTLSARIGFADGLEAWLGGVDGEAYNVFDVDIVGTEGRIVFTDLGHMLHRYPVQDSRAEHGFRQLRAAAAAQPTELSSAVRYAVEDLVRSIETGVEPACTPNDAYAAMALSLRLSEQATPRTEEA